LACDSTSMRNPLDDSLWFSQLADPLDPFN
jgi:hypothetical protein